jgi:microcin C transport system permease protein
MADVIGANPAAMIAEKPRRLSPISRRRWENFKANRRGYWAFWIFLALFGLSLCAEFIANDKPILASYKGELLVPVLIDYPEEKFGGFFAVTDYRSDVIRDEIEANGWMIWPPIRYSYRSANSNIPHSAPTAPFWLMDASERCSAYPEKEADRGCMLGNLNWLGTDDQARDVAARTIYGFRISVLFGLALTIASAIVGVAAGAVQGYFGGWTDLLMQRFIEIWSSMPVLYILLIIAAILPPGFFVLLGIMLLFSWVGFVGIVRAEFLRARRPRAGRRQRHDHVAAPPAQRHGRHAHLPAVHPFRLHHHAHLARFPRLRHAARFAVARRTDRAREIQPSGPVARPDSLHRHVGHALPADLHRRGRARCVRSEKDLRMISSGSRLAGRMERIITATRGLPAQ